MLTIAYVNTVWNVDEFCHLCCEFFLYMYTFAGSKKVLKNFSWGSWKFLEKSWIFLSV